MKLKQPSIEAYNKQIKATISKRIAEKMKECPAGMSEAKCRAAATSYVELNIWADVLESGWEVKDVSLEDGHLIMFVSRGKDVPLLGEIDVGQFNGLISAEIKGDVLELGYETQESMDNTDKALYAAGGAGGMAIFFMVLLVLLI